MTSASEGYRIEPRDNGPDIPEAARPVRGRSLIAAEALALGARWESGLPKRMEAGWYLRHGGCENNELGGLKPAYLLPRPQWSGLHGVS